MAMKFIKRKSALKPITGSIVDTFNINDKTTNAPSLRLMIDLLYPIGRGFIDFTDTDYSNWLGLTWERTLLGVSPIGYNPDDADFNQVGKTGGEKEHTLTENELARHSHGVQGLLSGNQTGGVPIGGGVASGSYSMGLSISTKELTESDQNPWLLKAVKGYGTTTPHNNMHPYQVVSYWKRVDPNAKTMISFSIYTREYQAEEGMTFYEWVNSEYNTDNWQVNSNDFVINNILSSGKTLYVNQPNGGGAYLLSSETIIADYVYSQHAEK